EWTMRSPSTSPLPARPGTSPLRRKLLLLLALLVAVSLLSDRLDADADQSERDPDNSESGGVDDRHLALLTALSRHPPSLRVFRLVFSAWFLLLMSALALWIWEGNDSIRKEDLERLLFAAVGSDDDDDDDDADDADEPDEMTGNDSYGPQAIEDSIMHNNNTGNPRKNHIILVPTLSSQSVLEAALDSAILTFACLICFTVASAEGGRYINQSIISNRQDTASIYLKYFCEATAPLFPLGLFCISIFKTLFPWKKKGKVGMTLVMMTVGAPFYEVTFRDGFIGDIITSAVRPLQDLLFTLFFLPLGLHAYWSSYTIDAAAIPIERSWIVHTLLLPACTLSPLWWRFCQNLRQCYDTKRRWPSLGNALKYMLAAEVATFGMFDPSIKKHPVWICAFAGATLYQVWWDVFMDWGLLEWDYVKGWFTLRSTRLYKRKWVYFLIFGINFALRFVGMITLIPPVHLSRTTGLIVNTFTDFDLFVGSLAACAEIFRRTVWALLRLEWEVIKTRKGFESQESPGTNTMEASAEVEMAELDYRNDMKPMPIHSATGGLWNKFPLKPLRWNDMSELNDIQVL
ncbi:hypothetical protein HJC23_004261, partial [Cyclotella cryptica]